MNRRTTVKIDLFLIGMFDGQLLTVAFTARENSDRIRIISARRSTRNEEDHYYSQNAF